MPHEALANLVRVTNEHMEEPVEIRILQFASVNFDAFDWEVFAALCSGGQLCMASEAELSSGPPLQRFLENNRITHTFLTQWILTLLPDAAYPHGQGMPIVGPRK